MLVQFALESCKLIAKDYFSSVIDNGAFPELVRCVVGFAQNTKYPKLCLQSVDMMKGMADTLFCNPIAEHHACVLSIYSGFCGTLMLGDLESRSRSMNYLFDSIKRNGVQFDSVFWDQILSTCIYPIFQDVKNPKALQEKFKSAIDGTEWISTTLVQGIRSLVELFSMYFSVLEAGNMKNVCNILVDCIVGQDNETISRIGASCLHQILESNAEKLNEKHWGIVVETIEDLFSKTLPSFERIEMDGDFSAASSQQGSPISSLSDLATTTAYSSEDRRKSVQGELENIVSSKEEFQKIIVKCVLHLLLLQTVNEIFILSSKVYCQTSIENLERIVACLQSSFDFSKKFNENMKLRLMIVKKGENWTYGRVYEAAAEFVKARDYFSELLDYSRLQVVL